jgi:hypothetical protein
VTRPASVADTDSAIEHEYERRLDARRRQLAAGERRHAWFGHARLLIAAGAAIVIWWGGLDALAWLFVPLGLFVLVALAHARLLNRTDAVRSAIHFYERGLARIRHEWIGHGRTGDAYRQPDHLYADDLDLFGRGGLFELLVTTRTRAGEETMARWLLAPASHAVARARQEAVRELATRLDLRETVAVIGDHVKVAVDAPLLRQWAASTQRIGGGPVRVAVALLVAVTLVTLAYWSQTGAFSTLAAVLLVTQVLVGAALRARVVAVIEAVEAPAHDLGVLSGLLRVIERESFQSPHLRALQQSLAGTHTASNEIARLSRLVALLASRRNVIFAVASGLLMWATQWAFAIDAWKRRAGVHIPHWLDVVGEFEALLALGGFAAEHPAYVFPDLVDGPPQMSASALAHATLGAEAVPNDLVLGADAPHLLVISGSNMSGKSTWMRTIGVAVVLARMGAPVRASACALSPLAVGAAIRVQDSLTDGRSRFFAEILRLKHIVDLARGEGGAVLFLLDEILSGTNSHDRRIGAEAVMIGLVNAGAIGLVTTHDLALAAITDRLGARALNAHFDDRFADGVLHFDFRLKPGIVETSNALALMRSIGIEV